MGEQAMCCLYCGGINSDRILYCIHCEQNLMQQTSNQPASRSQPPYQQPRQAPPTPKRHPPTAPPTAARQPVPPTPPTPPPPEPPTPFPPRNVTELQTLEQNTLPY